MLNVFGPNVSTVSHFQIQISQLFWPDCIGRRFRLATTTKAHRHSIQWTKEQPCMGRVTPPGKWHGPFLDFSQQQSCRDHFRRYKDCGPSCASLCRLSEILSLWKHWKIIQLRAIVNLSGFSVHYLEEHLPYLGSPIMGFSGAYPPFQMDSGWLGDHWIQAIHAQSARNRAATDGWGKPWIRNITE